MTDLYRIPLTAKGGATFTIPLGDVVVSLIPKFNYSSQCWTLDILDAQGEDLLLGLMLVPNIDILFPYPSVKEDLGSLVLIELNENDYQIVDYLGVNAELLWFPPGQEIVLPE